MGPRQHQAPAEPPKSVPFDASSTYTNQYPAHEVQARQAHHAPHPKGGLDLVLRFNPYHSHTASQVRQCQGALSHSPHPQSQAAALAFKQHWPCPNTGLSETSPAQGRTCPLTAPAAMRRTSPPHAVQRREQHAPVQAQKDCTPFDATSSYKVLLMACRYRGQ